MENQDEPEIIHNALDNFFNLSFDANAREQLKQISLWGKICSLSAFAGYVISLVVAIFGHKDYSMEAEGFSFGGYVRSGTSIGNVLLTILAGGIINYFLYRFAADLGQGVRSMDNMKLNTGFNNLRIYFKIFGIILIVVFSLLVLLFLFGLISALTKF
jgi:Family of unknown function (DUF5362)